MAPTPQGEAGSLETRQGEDRLGLVLMATRGPPLPCQVGSFDPYSDDPRLGIQKIFLCKYSGYLAVAGTAGQVAGWAGAGGAARRSDQGTLGGVQGLEGSKNRHQPPGHPPKMSPGPSPTLVALVLFPVDRGCLVPLETGLWDDGFSSRNQD